MLIHNNRILELKIQVNTGFRMAMIYFKDLYKFMNLPLCLLPKSFNWSVGPRRPSDQSDAFVAGFLYMFVSIYLSIYLSIFLCLVIGFRPRFHSL